MQEYRDRNALIAEIRKTAEKFISEFEGLSETDAFKKFDDADRSPSEMIAYQLGWLNLLQNWDMTEKRGETPSMPSLGYKWNNLGSLYQSFYDKYKNNSLSELRQIFAQTLNEFISWIESFSEEELFLSRQRKWASSTPSNWPIWKWIHINSVAPFKTFRAKIRKWKKLNT